MNPLMIGAVSAGFQVLWLVSAIVVTVALLQLYLRTRMSGFLWLLVATAIWPFVSRLLGVIENLYLPYYAARTASPLNEITAMLTVLGGLGSMIEIVLLLVAVLMLKRQLQARLAELPAT